MNMNRFKRIQQLSEELTECKNVWERNKIEDEIALLEDEIEMEQELEYADNHGGHQFQ